MKKLIKIIAIIIIFIIAVLYFLDGLEFTEAEKEWCKEYRPLLPIEVDDEVTFSSKIKT